ncbi:MAG: type II toxin-antitoxin system RelE/ParE family toxin [Deltaproteobacteria bacterium]|nr:type II toxin-antitoxin system RelE/ParE family toxin [Deltaproteobacteria bacterium]MBW2192191.1 type II toxin-antitoxin system RelE/ParE family toxin [Deltaproteobacteria bacterium]
MSYKLAFKKSVARDLKKLSKDDAKRILDKIEQALPERADTFPLLTGKFAGLRKFRIGDYRVIYTLTKNTALVLRISHRRDAYR